jgi:ornithine carbamoyltransferase
VPPTPCVDFEPRGQTAILVPEGVTVLNKRDFLSVLDFSPKDILSVLSRATELKRGGTSQALAGKNVAMLFEKPSLRTRVSFDVGIKQLGGHAIYLGRDEVGLGGRESVSDVARVLSRYVDAIVARTYAHTTLDELATHTSIPVINALSDIEHPCQALGDLLTIEERFGKLEGVTIAFIGDGNNVAASLALAAASVSANFVIASPEGYELPHELIGRAQELASASGATLRQIQDPEDATSGCDVVYTDTWVSMGQESKAEQRVRDFERYQVTHQLMENSAPGAIFMHPLPAHHGEEVSAGMLEHPQSAVFDQAENRLHAQKAVMEKVMAERPG